MIQIVWISTRISLFSVSQFEKSVLSVQMNSLNLMRTMASFLQRIAMRTSEFIGREDNPQHDTQVIPIASEPLNTTDNAVPPIPDNVVDINDAFWNIEKFPVEPPLLIDDEIVDNSDDRIKKIIRKTCLSYINSSDIMLVAPAA